MMSRTFSWVYILTFNVTIMGLPMFQTPMSNQVYKHNINFFNLMLVIVNCVSGPNMLSTDVCVSVLV